MADTRYLVLRRQTYYVAVEVPPSVRPNLGKKRLVVSLRTRSLATAQARRWDVIAALRRQIQAARPGREGDRLIEDALFLREAYEAARRHDAETGEGGRENTTTADIVQDMAEEAGARFEEGLRGGLRGAVPWNGDAASTPLRTLAR